MHLGLLPVDAGTVMPWMKDSLQQGSALARSWQSILENLDRFYIIGKPGHEAGFGGASQGIFMADADRVMERVVAKLSIAASMWIVDDDLRRAGDPAARGNVALLDTRLLRWCRTSQGADGVVTMMRYGASGYPLNAAALGGRDHHFPPAPGSQLTDHAQREVQARVAAIIVGIYDGESFAVATNEHL